MWKELEQYRITGIDYDFDGIVDNPNVNGSMRDAFNAAVHFPQDYKHQVIRTPADRPISISGEQDWMSFNTGNGTFTFNPDPDDIGTYSVQFKTGNSTWAEYVIIVE